MNGCVLMAPSHTIQQLFPREGIDLLHLVQEFGGIVQRSVCMPDSILSWIQSKRKIVSDIKQQRHPIKQGLLFWQWKSVQFCFLCFFPKHLLNKLLTKFKLACSPHYTTPLDHAIPHWIARMLHDHIRSVVQLAEHGFDGSLNSECTERANDG